MQWIVVPQKFCLTKNTHCMVYESSFTLVHAQPKINKLMPLSILPSVAHNLAWHATHSIDLSESKLP